jgi:hypothetical protein
VSDHIGRRELLIGAGAAFLAAEATGANTADSHESTETEKANVKLFREFQDSFDQSTLDIDKVMASSSHPMPRSDGSMTNLESRVERPPRMQQKTGLATI